MTWTYLAIGFAAGCAWYTTVDQVFNWLDRRAQRRQDAGR